jgi:hypothetical protein
MRGVQLEQCTELLHVVHMCAVCMCAVCDCVQLLITTTPIVTLTCCTAVMSNVVTAPPLHVLKYAVGTTQHCIASPQTA